MGGNLPEFENDLSWDNENLYIIRTLKLRVAFVKNHCNVKKVGNFLLSQCIFKFSKEETRNLENQLYYNENLASSALSDEM